MLECGEREEALEQRQKATVEPAPSPAPMLPEDFSLGWGAMYPNIQLEPSLLAVRLWLLNIRSSPDAFSKWFFC
ncbi:hypothetical protein PG995_005329 [Apiospora arundinis]